MTKNYTSHGGIIETLICCILGALITIMLTTACISAYKYTINTLNDIQKEQETYGEDFNVYLK